MALYVDCAFLPDVEAIYATFPVSGTTTNPSILLAAVERGQRLSDVEVCGALLSRCPGLVFMQPTADDAEGLLAMGMRYVDLDPSRVVLKLPMSAAGLAAARALARNQARFSFTAVSTVAQAYCGVLADANWIIPYFGRLRRSGVDSCQVLSDMQRVATGHAPTARILAASLKSSSDVVEATLAGAHDVTAPPAVIRSLVEDPLSYDAMARFAADWERVQTALGVNENSAQ